MISNRCARKSLVTNCNSIISKNYLRFLVDSNDTVYFYIHFHKIELRKPCHNDNQLNYRKFHKTRFQKGVRIRTNLVRIRTYST